jgi:hypothetical protein
LGAGVLYGIVHRNTLFRQAEHKKKEDEYAFKEELIKEARAEYMKRKSPNNGPSELPLKYCGDCWADWGVAEVNWNDPKSIEEAVQRFAEQK